MLSMQLQGINLTLPQATRKEWLPREQKRESPYPHVSATASHLNLEIAFPQHLDFSTACGSPD